MRNLLSHESPWPQSLERHRVAATRTMDAEALCHREMGDGISCSLSTRATASNIDIVGLCSPERLDSGGRAVRTALFGRALALPPLYLILSAG